MPLCKAGWEHLQRLEHESGQRQHPVRLVLVFVSLDEQ